MAELFFDLSNNNGSGADVPVALQHSCSLVLKATEATTFKDPYLPRWAAAAVAAGKPWAPYDFARPGLCAGAAEAKHFCDYVESLGHGQPWRAIYDFETTSTNTSATTRHALDWGDYVRQRWPLSRLTLYSGWGFATKFVPDRALAVMFDYWHSGYPGGYTSVPNPDTVKRPAPVPPFDHYVAWQWTSIYPIPGVGRGDANICLPGWHYGPAVPKDVDMDQDTKNQLGRIELYAAAAAIRSQDVQDTFTDAELKARITELYVTYLGREPDANGLAAWVAQKRSGRTMGEIEKSIASSAEARRRVAG